MSDAVAAPPLFLTPDELHELTGLRRPSAQIRWIKARQIRHYVNAVGHPVIARDWLIQREAPRPERARPNLRAINGGA